MTSSIDNDLSACLEALPNWDHLTAYERAFRCCEELTQRGEDLPSWLGIRQVIGKGSGQDINRAKSDFRKQQVEAVRKMRGVVKGVPEVLAPLLMTLWTTAIKEAGQEFEVKLETITHNNQVALATVQQLEYEKNEAVNRLRLIEIELLSSNHSLSKIQDDYAIETKLRKTAESQCHNLQELLNEQSEQYRKATEQANYDIKTAITRLEGAEKHALLEIERVKQEEQIKRDQADTRWQKKHSEQLIIQSRLEQTIETLRTELLMLTKQNEKLRTENNFLHEKIKQFEDQIIIYQKNNSSLLESVAILNENKKRKFKRDKLVQS